MIASFPFLHALRCMSLTCVHDQDIGGEEKFSGKTRFYYQNTVAAIVVADASKPKTLVVRSPPMIFLLHCNVMRTAVTPLLSLMQNAEAWIRDLRAKAVIKGPSGETLSLPIILFVNKGKSRSSCTFHDRRG